jgi:hypothetical protein
MKLTLIRDIGGFGLKFSLFWTKPNQYPYIGGEYENYPCRLFPANTRGEGGEEIVCVEREECVPLNPPPSAQPCQTVFKIYQAGFEPAAS